MTTKPARRTKAKAAPVADETGGVDRRRIIITEAARLFAANGFAATSMREIAAATGILAGSIYYHFASKEDLFVAVYVAGLESVEAAVRVAITDIEDPWDRLEAAAAAHCSALIDANEFMTIVTPLHMSRLGSLRRKIIARRDQYEKLMVELIGALKLPDDVDPQLFRLNYLGALNWVPTWYRPGYRFTAAEIGRRYVQMLRPAKAAKKRSAAGAD